MFNKNSWKLVGDVLGWSCFACLHPGLSAALTHGLNVKLMTHRSNFTCLVKTGQFFYFL